MTVLVLASAVSLIGCNKNKRPATKTPQPAPSSDTYGGGATPTPVHPPVVYEPPPPAPVPAPAPEPVAVPSSGAHTYTVKKGDTLSKIAREQLGGINQLGPLIRANPGINKDVIKPGQVINLP